MSDEPRRRPVRSFVRREGRLTPAQADALETLWPRFGVEFGNEALDLEQIFGRVAPRTLEIGFGSGENLVRAAAASPQRDFLGIEVHRPGVGRLLRELNAQKIENVRVLCHDAVEVLAHGVPAASLDEVLLLFPDPWPKKRHHKRRIVQAEFLQAVAKSLRPGGHFNIATDWQNYAEHIAAVVQASSEFEIISTAAPERAETRFERRGKRLGHEVFDFSCRRL